MTDGLQAYTDLQQGATHILCRFHHLQSVTHWVKHYFATAAEINARKSVMQQVLQTRDKRTVERTGSGVGDYPPWVKGVEEKVPKRICSVGSVSLPSTTDAIERFFRAFQLIYSTRGGFHSVLSAKRKLPLFVVEYVFTQHATTGQAPIEVIVPEARHMPLERAPGAGVCQVEGRDGRLAVGRGSRSLDARRGKYATLTH